MSQIIKNIMQFIAKHRIPAIIISALLVVCIAASAVLLAKPSDKNNTESVSSTTSVEQNSSEESVEEIVSEITSMPSSEISTSSETSSQEKTESQSKPSSTKPTTSKPASSQTLSVSKPSTSGSFKYNSNVDINDNVFLDSMVYTGYNLKKHIADGNMWKYILASRKRGLGYLSDIRYAGGSSGYETTSSGKPDIKAFERKGLVCASYVTYVYFNYLPNVAGIDTSSLTRPKRSYSANDWYIAAKDWVKKGYATTISFSASKTSSGFINFKPNKSIPIGSIMAFCDARNRSDHCSHVAIYAGYKNGYNWVYHVGNDNGPEFCAVERMHFGPDPQWPIKVITTPTNIRMQAALEITLKDDSAAPISDVEFTLQNTSSGKKIALGKTNSKGVIFKENLPYGKYKLLWTAKEGYENKELSRAVELTTAKNSLTKISITNIKKPIVIPESSQQSTADSSEEQSSDASDIQSSNSTLPENSSDNTVS